MPFYEDASLSEVSVELLFRVSGQRSSQPPYRVRPMIAPIQGHQPVIHHIQSATWASYRHRRLLRIWWFKETVVQFETHTPFSPPQG